MSTWEQTRENKTFSALVFRLVDDFFHPLIKELFPFFLRPSFVHKYSNLKVLFSLNFKGWNYSQVWWKDKTKKKQQSVNDFSGKWTLWKEGKSEKKHKQTRYSPICIWVINPNRGKQVDGNILCQSWAFFPLPSLTHLKRILFIRLSETFLGLPFGKESKETKTIACVGELHGITVLFVAVWHLRYVLKFVSLVCLEKRTQ